VSTQRLRLQSGGRIDRNQRLSFSFNGKTLFGHPGDTLASALIANGIRVVARSFKYHRPRGIHSAGFDEPSALVELNQGSRLEPNTKATVIELYEGLMAKSQNCWPSVDFDLMAVNGLFKPFFAAGFYYKTFMWPASFWERLYEPVIRRAAGMGKASALPDPDRYERASAHCDLLIAGGGVAGLAAALTAGRAGARVLLCEDHWELGGRLLSERGRVGGMPAQDWLAGVKAELAALPNVQLLVRTTVVAGFDGGTWLALERVSDHMTSPDSFQPRQRLWQVVAGSTVVATGALERALAFPDNDRPGVMLATAARTYLNRHAVRIGERIAIYTATDEGWELARDLVAVGHQPVVVVEYRAQVPDAYRDLASHVPTIVSGRITATSGRLGINRITVQGPHGAKLYSIDALASSGGFNPELALTCMHGSRPVWSEAQQTFLPGPAVAPGEAPVVAVGAAAGKGAVAVAWQDGARVAAELLSGRGMTVEPIATVEADAATRVIVPAFWPARHPSASHVFLDLQHDVTASDVELAHREGYRSVEHLKRYTTLGMATDQGRSSSVDGLALMAALTGRSIAESGVVLSRPPVVPLAIGSVAGAHRQEAFRPVRRVPIHEWAEEQGALFVDVGQWKRPLAYPLPGEDLGSAVLREVRSVRSAVGVTDISTLGKIEVEGPDAAAFLDRVCATRPSALKPGRAGYLLVLREDGYLKDDGLILRFAEDRYLLCVSTAHAAPVWRHILHSRQVLFPEYDVSLTAVTDGWAQFAVAGPRSSRMIAALVDPECGFEAAAFPLRTARELTVAGGVPARLCAFSFSGERAFELGVPAGLGDYVIRRIMAVGEPHGIVAYGTDAMSVMRIEKGYPAGAEINGQTTAFDLGFAKMLARDKDHIGRVLSARPALNDPARPRLIGLKPVNPEQRLTGGAHVVAEHAGTTAADDLGWLTSVCYSPTLESWIALAMISGGPDRLGERVRVIDPLRGLPEVLAEIVPSCFVDPEGKRGNVD
jgi:methylglutamate dehydrogenase subunit C